MTDGPRQSLVTGLTASPKYIPAWYNYDADGSRLQYDITNNDRDSYLNRSNLSVMENNVQPVSLKDVPGFGAGAKPDYPEKKHCPTVSTLRPPHAGFLGPTCKVSNEHTLDIVPTVPYDLTLVDIGSGNCSKSKILINELLKRQTTLTFYPLDISEEFLTNATKELSEEYDDSLVVHHIAADYVQGIDQLKRVDGPKLITWICCILNLPYDEQVNTLRRISSIMTDKCRLVFSADITQDREAVLKAYTDKTGLKQSFYQYAITRLNKEEGSQIDLSKFTYEVDFISDKDPQYMSYVRAYIQAKEDIRYHIPGLKTDLVMEKGERLYFHEGVGASCKYTLEQLQNIVKKAGLRLVDTWMDEQQHAVFCGCVTA